MSDADALLATVLAEPAADTPRLVYADYLDESGPADAVARAEFIRVQCELAAGGADPDRRALLAAREAVLLAAYNKAWLAPLKVRGEALENAGTHGQFRRGFVELVWMPAAVYLAKADRLFARAPVRELRLTRVKLAEAEALLALPASRKLAALDLSDLRMGDDAARLLARAPAVAAFDVLRLRGCNITDAGAAALATTPFDWRPDVIDLAWNPVTDAGRAVLAKRFPGTAFGPAGG